MGMCKYSIHCGGPYGGYEIGGCHATIWERRYRGSFLRQGWLTGQIPQGLPRETYKCTRFSNWPIKSTELPHKKKMQARDVFVSRWCSDSWGYSKDFAVSNVSVVRSNGSKMIEVRWIRSRIELKPITLDPNAQTPAECKFPGDFKPLCWNSGLEHL